MAIQRQLRRGTKAENDLYTGPEAELVCITDTKQLALHDGETPGGKLFSTGITTTLTGDEAVYVNQSKTYIISNYDSFAEYEVTATDGAIYRSGQYVYYTAPETTGTVTITITADGSGRSIVFEVLPAGVETPSITSPENGATGQMDVVSVEGSAFTWAGTSDTHEMSDWKLTSDTAGTEILQSSTSSTTNLTTWSVSGLDVSTTYYLFCRYKGTSNGWSEWSSPSSFITASEFNAYIDTPTATPSSFGASFEGGYYTGMIWNELVESSTSAAIATGSIVFTVPDMNVTPIVYAGQTLEVRSRANPSNKFVGTVAGASGTSLTVDVTSVGGSGTYSDWSIMAQYRVIVAPKASGENSSIQLKNSNSWLPSACQTISEGYKATQAMVAADSSTVYPAAHWCNNLTIDGRSDWYLPARDELELCWRNLKPTSDSNYTSADRGVSSIDYENLGSYGDTSNQHGVCPNSSPSGAAHTSSDPAQCAASIGFRTGETNAFAYGSYLYWSSSEFSEANGWDQHWHSSHPGNQYGYYKTSSYYVRAVRRSII